MSLDKSYIDFVKELKERIVVSRYKAANLANREQLLLYYNIGYKLSEKIALEKWGNSILKNIAADLQTDLPGLRGFSERNLYNMKLFYDNYINFPVSQSSTTELNRDAVIPQSSTTKFDNYFFGISFISSYTPD